MTSPDPPTQAGWVELRTSHLSAAINPLGAQLSILRDSAGRDLLWDGDPAVWNGRAPILFPIVGTLAGGHYRLGSRTYQLSRHGFARGKPFEVIERGPTAVTFRLRADDSTLQVYPFQFELDVRFSLEEAVLSVTAIVANRGTGQMPASIGYHPAFRWPLPYDQSRAAHFIEFEHDEPAPLRLLTRDGVVSNERHPTPINGRRLILRDELFQRDALIFDQIRSRSVTYGATAGPRIRVEYPDAPYLGIWTKPGASFICIEPWRGIADPEAFNGDFTTKPGVFQVAPGSTERLTMRISLLKD